MKAGLILRASCGHYDVEHLQKGPVKQSKICGAYLLPLLWFVLGQASGQTSEFQTPPTGDFGWVGAANSPSAVEMGAESGWISDLEHRAQAGVAPAQNRLAYLYTYGEGVVRGYGEAARWYKAAADQGFAPAQYNLGALFEHGLGVQRDYTKAAAYYRAAADQGHRSAQARMGLMYERGWGVRKSLAQAMNSYRSAAE